MLLKSEKVTTVVNTEETYHFSTSLFAYSAYYLMIMILVNDSNNATWEDFCVGEKRRNKK
jgi:hypothetical protein